MKVSLITCHTPFSKRKAGFHWIADAFHRKGWTVNFITAYSIVDWLKNDYRNALIKNHRFNVPIELEPGFISYLAFRWWRPFNSKFKFINNANALFFSRYGDWKNLNFHNLILGSDIIIIESLYDILYLPILREKNPSAKFIYRVSDDLSTFNVHPSLLTAEEALAGQFNLVSVPNTAIFDRFKKFCSPVLQPHGIPKYLFDKNYTNPYSSTRKKAVFVGNLLFDYEFLRICSSEFKDVDFHIIGPLQKKVISDNIIYYGEMPYEETIKYIKYADVGLSPMISGGLMGSNKIIQYKYCGIPIIISDVNKSNEDGILYYKIGDCSSIIKAMSQALKIEKMNKQSLKLFDWDDLINSFIDQTH